MGEGGKGRWIRQGGGLADQGRVITDATLLRLTTPCPPCAAAAKTEPVGACEREEITQGNQGTRRLWDPTRKIYSMPISAAATRPRPCVCEQWVGGPLVMVAGGGADKTKGSAAKTLLVSTTARTQAQQRQARHLQTLPVPQHCRDCRCLPLVLWGVHWEHVPLPAPTPPSFTHTQLLL